MLTQVACELVLVYLLTSLVIQRLHKFSYELLINYAFFFLTRKGSSQKTKQNNKKKSTLKKQ